MRTYRFQEHHSGLEQPTMIIVKESDLTQAQKNLLLGDAINSFNKLPDELKNKFMARMNDNLFDKMENEM